MVDANTKKNKVFVWLTFFLLLYCSNDTLLFGTNINRIFFGVHIAILCALFLFWLFCGKYVKYSVARYAVALIVCNFLTCLVNKDMSMNIIKYAYCAFLLLFSSIIVTRIPFKIFALYYQRIMTFLTVMSILCILIGTLFPVLLSYFPRIMNENYYPFYFLGFGYIDAFGSGIIHRSYGIFREPGVNAFFISIALMFGMFTSESKNLKQIVILVIGLVLTFSTAGIIVLGLLLVIDFFQSSTRNIKKLALELLLLVSISVFLMYCQDTYIYKVIFGKLKNRNSSIDSRIGSFVVNFKIFLQDPIFGKGWTSIINEFPKYAYLSGYLNLSNTNTLIKYLAIYGIIPAIMLLWGLMRLCRMLAKNMLYSFALFAVLFLALSNEDMTVNIILFLLAFYGLCEYSKKSEFI